MKTKLYIIIMLVVLCFAGLQNIQAQTFKGKLTSVKMNNKPYDEVNDVMFTLSNLGEQAYKLKSSPIGPIGKMPGTINVDATVLIDSSKKILPDRNVSKAGTLNLTIGTNMDIYMTNISGNIKGDSINFVLDTYSVEIFGIKAVNASVTFKGTKVSN